MGGCPETIASTLITFILQTPIILALRRRARHSAVPVLRFLQFCSFYLDV